MRVLIATDAWHPQVNGVVRTLTSLSRSALRLGVRIEFLTPDGFRTFPVPTYPGLRVALPSRQQIAILVGVTPIVAVVVATLREREGATAAPLDEVDVPFEWRGISRAWTEADRSELDRALEISELELHGAARD